MLKIFIIVVWLYLSIGLYCGLQTKMNDADTNLLGVGFVAVTWPAWINGSPIPEPNVPEWCFTDKDN